MSETAECRQSRPSCTHVRVAKSGTAEDGPRVRYRCRACGFAFGATLAGVVACPRCSAIADHEQLGPR